MATQYPLTKQPEATEKQLIEQSKLPKTTWTASNIGNDLNNLNIPDNLRPLQLK